MSARRPDVPRTPALDPGARRAAIALVLVLGVAAIVALRGDGCGGPGHDDTGLDYWHSRTPASHDAGAR